VINLVCAILVRRRSASYRPFIKCWLLPAQREITDTIVCINAETPVSRRGRMHAGRPRGFGFRLFCVMRENVEIIGKAFFSAMIALAVVPKDI
jgi:hypothetical protein